MGNWITITDADLVDHKVAALVNALKTAALADEQGDPTPGLLQAVVDRVRRKVASCPSNRLDADPAKVPAGLKTLTLDLLVFALKNRLEMELSDAEKEQLRTHERDLSAIAACREAVEQPDAPVSAPVEGAGAVDLVHATQLQAGRKQTAGL